MQDKYKIFLSNELPALLIFLPPFKEDLDCLFTGSNPASVVYPPFVKTEKFIKKSLAQVKEGYLAGLVLVNKNSPRLNSQTNIFASILYSISEVDINTVIVDGKIIVKDGKLLTIALHGLLKEVNNTAKRLIQKPYGKPIQTFG